MNGLLSNVIALMGLFISYFLASIGSSYLTSISICERPFWRFLDVVVYLVIVSTWVGFCSVKKRCFHPAYLKDGKFAGKECFLYLTLVALLLFVFLNLAGTGALFSFLLSTLFGVISYAAFLGLVFIDNIWSEVMSDRCKPDKRILLVGTGSEALAFARGVMNGDEMCAVIVAVVDDTIFDKGFEEQPFPIFHLNELSKILAREVIDEVLVFLPARSRYDDILEVVKLCTRQGISVTIRQPWDIEKTLSGDESTRYQVSYMMGFTFVESGSSLLNDPFYRVIKRIFDIIIATLMLVLSSPLMLVAALAIKLSSPGPVIFRQKRLGQSKRLFTMYKFRTMYVDAEKYIDQLMESNITKGATFKMVNDPRITKVGKILRKTSIDELPQLFNVLKGEMSIVGPRPLPVRDYEHFYEDSHRRRFSVKPGLTGLWQVSGRSNITFEEWMKLDLFYVDHWSFKLDLNIFLKTIRVVLLGVGAE